MRAGTCSTGGSVAAAHLPSTEGLPESEASAPSSTWNSRRTPRPPSQASSSLGEPLQGTRKDTSSLPDLDLRPRSVPR